MIEARATLFGYVRKPATGFGARRGWLIRLTGEDGSEGWGEAAPLPGFSRDEPADALRALKSLGGQIAVDPSDPLGTAPRNELPPSARFAVELAALNLAAAARGVSVREIIRRGAPGPSRPGAPAGPVRSAALVTGPPDGWAAAVRHAAGEGFDVVKLKVGRSDPGNEARAIVALPDFPGVRLRLDANRAWSPEEALRFWSLCGGPRVEFVEEPLRDPSGLRSLADSSDMPIALDETLAGAAPEELFRFIRPAAVVLKPTVLGGIAASLRWAAAAGGLPVESPGGGTPAAGSPGAAVRVVVSSAYETGVGLTGLAELAAALGAPAAAGSSAALGAPAAAGSSAALGASAAAGLSAALGAPAAAGLDTSSAFRDDVVRPAFRVRGGTVPGDGRYVVRTADLFLP